MLMVTNSFVVIILNSIFYCLSQKRFAYVQVKEPLALVTIHVQTGFHNVGRN